MEENKNILNIEEALNKVKNKENKIYFYVSNAEGTEGSVGVTYSHAKALKDLGFNVIMLHDNLEYKKPVHLKAELIDIEHLALNKNRNKIKVSVTDIMVYPESHPDVIEKTRSLKCIKVVLCQSHSRLLPSMLPGMNWFDMDIEHVITTSGALSNYISSIFGDKLGISVITPSVDDTLFKSVGSYKKPTIAVYGRYQKDILKLAKEFYAMYPNYNMFTFKDMRGMSKEEFGKALSESFLAVNIDRDGAFPMFEIECAKVKTNLIGLVPDLVTEHTQASSKNLVINPFLLPRMVGTECSKYLLNQTPEHDRDLYFDYSVEGEKAGVSRVFNMLINRRVEELTKIYNNLTNDKK